MKSDKWVFAIITAIVAFALWYYVLQLLGVKDDKTVNYFKNLYNYTIAFALLSGRAVYIYFKNKEGKKS